MISCVRIALGFSARRWSTLPNYSVYLVVLKIIQPLKGSSKRM